MLTRKHYPGYEKTASRLGNPLNLASVSLNSFFGLFVLVKSKSLQLSTMKYNTTCYKIVLSEIKKKKLILGFVSLKSEI